MNGLSVWGGDTFKLCPSHAKKFKDANLHQMVCLEFLGRLINFHLFSEYFCYFLSFCPFSMPFPPK